MLLFLWVQALSFIITFGRQVQITNKNTPAVTVSFVASFKHHHPICSFYFLLNKPSYDGKSLVEKLPSAIVATVDLDDPSSNIKKIYINYYWAVIN